MAELTTGRLSRQVAFISGAGAGFGAGIAAKFVAEGAQVVIGDINLDAAQQVADELNQHATNNAAQDQPNAWPCHVDVSQGVSVSNAVAAGLAQFGKLDILVNNAGLGLGPTALEELDEATFDQVLAVNAKSIYLFAHHLVPHLKAQGHGVILNIASTAGVSPRPNLTWYNASKGWVITATKSMAVELASHNIRVNAINPVAGETAMLTTFMGEDTQDKRNQFLSTIPLGRFSTPQDIGNAACFLCSSEASLITGVALEVDGGRCI